LFAWSILILDGGPEFGVNVGAPVWLRLWGGGEDAGLVRWEDWDSLSDWGQLVRGLKLGSDNAPLGVWFGALEGYSLLSAHLVRRYSNRMNPDYHPAGGFLTGTLGPVYTEAFASDVLGARSSASPRRRGVTRWHCPPCMTGGELEDARSR